MSSSNYCFTYRFLRRQVRRSGISISLRTFHSLLWSTQVHYPHIKYSTATFTSWLPFFTAKRDNIFNIRESSIEPHWRKPWNSRLSGRTTAFFGHTHPFWWLTVRVRRQWSDLKSTPAGRTWKPWVCPARSLGDTGSPLYSPVSSFCASLHCFFRLTQGKQK